MLEVSPGVGWGPGANTPGLAIDWVSPWGKPFKRLWDSVPTVMKEME